MKTYVLYNPLSSNGQGLAGAGELKQFYPLDDLEFIDITKVVDIQKEIGRFPAEERCVICGGDGTLHHFVNDLNVASLEREVLYYPTGTGNDFINDIGRTKEQGPFPINDKLVHLPFVTVNGRTRRFINNVGYGLDGYVCEIADLKRDGKKKINYTGIAFKGLMVDYHPANATIVADGVRKNYKNVWLAPAMNGRYCGGGVMLAPDQDRFDPLRQVTSTVMYGVGRLKALTRFKNVCAGRHEGYDDMIDTVKANEISVTFDTPCALQVDGETFTGVLQYYVRSDTTGM